MHQLICPSTGKSIARFWPQRRARGRFRTTKTRARENLFRKPFQTDPAVQPSRGKFCSLRKSEIMNYSRHPHPFGGAYRDRHGRWMRDAMDA